MPAPAYRPRAQRQACRKHDADMEARYGQHVRCPCPPECVKHIGVQSVSKSQEQGLSERGVRLRQGLLQGVGQTAPNVVQPTPEGRSSVLVCEGHCREAHDGADTLPRQVAGVVELLDFVRRLQLADDQQPVAISEKGRGSILGHLLRCSQCDEYVLRLVGPDIVDSHAMHS